ncbi:carbohydrate-binding module family 50 protein [Periconia macrospinosa]|uniref:Carbohydrate-binding module family 50 protein n=1 Tax=Periconia macrospinosa TaxID=97972 RepID=A0A2V1D4Y0_9PLEO|nr:carbohydrate-binding module family 50 protein [Periconia macrospinosa]
MRGYFFFLCARAAAQRYQVFQGDGSLTQGWPDRSKWLSYEDLWTRNLYVLNSSCSPTYGVDNSPNELQAIKESLPEAAEYAGVPPSLFLVMMMQESDGCVRVGTTANEPEKYYRAARAYNAGPYGVIQTHLEQGGATRCYASDIANQLLGWTRRADKVCSFDSSGIAPQVTAPQSPPTIGSSTMPSPGSSLGHAPNTPTNCTQSYLVTAGDTCNKVAELYNIIFSKLRALNPSLNSECTNLWLGYTYYIS